ncbi:MAG: TlpA disulfide reductase family protein [Candidatus Rokuibacteriota bacterium]
MLHWAPITMRPTVAAPLLVALVGVGLAVGLGAPGLRADADPYAALMLTRVTPSIEGQDFTVPRLGGGSLSLAAYRGQVVFLNFWATWCVPCRVEMPAMERLYGRLRDKGLVVLAVSIDADADPEPVRLFVREHRLTFPVGLDRKLRVVNLYGVRALPSTLLLDRSGRIVARAFGIREWDGADAVALLEELLARK